MSEVELSGITVSRDDRRILDGIDLVVAAGERIALLGPSGSGKTTLLRVIAGTEQPETGSVRFDGIDVTTVPARARDVAMVDQRGSLQPHLDVRGNLGFALRIRRVDRTEVAERVEAEARAFSLRDLLGRRPQSLSEGERQGIALARSIVRRSSLLLMDDPLARLDPPRQDAVLRELIEMQEGYGVTMIASSNDQRIATAIGHRLAMLHHGHVVQSGPPDELFRRPGSTFVAGFLGDQPMNLVPGELRRDGGPVTLVAGDLEVRSWDLGLTTHAAQPVTIGIRPTDLHLRGTDRYVALPGVVRSREFLGHAIAVTVEVRADRLVATVPRPGPGIGEHVRLWVAPRDIHVFDATGRAMAHGV